MLRVPAYAKVNLSLEILGRRPDGFHEIVSVTQIISLADDVCVAPEDSFSVEMQPAVVDPGENLAARAADLLAARTGRTPSGMLHIRKRIPLAAGLGGGSSDAAAALRLLDRLWETRLGPRRLATLAAALGSDVPLFLGSSGLSLARGRGELVEALPPVRTYWLTLICPEGAPAGKTRALYQALRPEEYGDGSTTLALADQLAAAGPVTHATLANSFDAAASRVYPGFAELRARLAEAIGQPVHLTGAGPTLFAAFTHSGPAHQAARRAAELGLRTIVARSIAHRPRIRSVRAPESIPDRFPT